MSSASGRGILSGQPLGGFPLRVSYDKIVVHTAVEGMSQLDTVYVYAFAVRRSSNASGAVASVRVELSVVDASGSEYVVALASVPGLPCSSPTLVLNGSSKQNAARIRARALDGEVGLYGWYHRSTVNVPPSVTTVIGRMVLSYQTIAFASADETRMIDTSLPVTLISTSHATSGKCRATLAAAETGTIKYIIMNGKSPLADVTQGHCSIVPASARFPDGEDSRPALGTMTLQDVGDGAQLIYTGVHWMICGVGTIVD